jgi:hypothetical protein
MYFETILTRLGSGVGEIPGPCEPPPPEEHPAQNASPNDAKAKSGPANLHPTFEQIAYTEALSRLPLKPS